MMKIYIIILMMIILICPVMANDNKSAYRVFVDHKYGFYKVYESNGSSVNYENRTLNISRGDIVTWVNDEVADARLTIVSRQNLWNESNGILLWSDKQFSYTFNDSGIYDIYIREYSRFGQKIIVGPIEIENDTNSIVNRTNITNPNLVVDSVVDSTNENKTTTNTSTNNSVMSATPPVEKKQGTEAIVLITVTSLLIYIFDRKIKGDD